VRAGTGGANTLAGLGGNDTLNGDAAVDLVSYGGSARVTVDLSLATDKATRGSEVDTLTNVEGAVGSSAGDVFRGNQFNNYWQGGARKDTASGGSSRDLYDFNAAVESGPGSASRDVITDFDHLVDDFDLAGIDTNTTVAGDQAFRFVGTAGLGTTPGTVGYFVSGGNTIVRASNDSDSTAELEIQLAGLVTPTVDNFYL
jgi:hypothetical protein